MVGWASDGECPLTVLACTEVAEAQHLMGWPLRVDVSKAMFRWAGRLWHLELGQMQPPWAGPIVRRTIRVAIALAFLNIAFGIVVLALILARH
jgi:hypothetical protein